MALMAVLQPLRKRLAAGATAVVIAVLLRPKLQRWWRRRCWSKEQDRLATLVSFEDAPAVAARSSTTNGTEAWSSRAAVASPAGPAPIITTKSLAH